MAKPKKARTAKTVPYSVFEGRVTFHMLPFANTLTYEKNLEAIKQLPDDFEALNNNRKMIYLILQHVYSRTVDIQFEDEPSDSVLALYDFWNERNGNISAMFDRMLELPTPFLDAWWDAYKETDDQSLKAPIALQTIPDDDTDPES